jgi:hypothetical protein
MMWDLENMCPEGAGTSGLESKQLRFDVTRLDVRSLVSLLAVRIPDEQENHVLVCIRATTEASLTMYEHSDAGGLGSR